MSISLRPAVFVLVVLFFVDTTACARPIILDEHPIDSNYAGMSCVVVFDLDGDGDLDLIGGSETTPYSQSIGVAWWRNNGGDPMTWTRFYVDASFDHVMSVEVAYVDNDTFPDVVATSWSTHQIAWWKNSGNPAVGWSRNTVRSGFVNAHDAECLDMNQDGFTDVVGINSTPGSVIVCYGDGADPPAWSVQTLSTTFSGGKSVSIVDLDRDGDADVLGTAADANVIAWWENQGGDPVTWAYHVIATGFAGSHDIDVVDMNGDSVYDVVAAGWLADEVSYWTCNDLGTNDWSKTVVTNQLDLAVKALGRDIDFDGDVDVVAVGKIPGELTVYENEGGSWTPVNLKQNFIGGWALAGEDLDGDGDVDVIAGASSARTLAWWENGSIDVPVQIAAFEARSSADGVVLSWELLRDDGIRVLNIYKRREGEPVFKQALTVRPVSPRERIYVDRDVAAGKTYHYYLVVVEQDGSETRSQVVSVETAAGSLILNQNRPNPFNPVTKISFELPEPALTNLAIYNLNGELIKTILNKTSGGGFYECTWDGTDERGASAASGVYFYRLTAGKTSITRKMVLLK